MNMFNTLNSIDTTLDLNHELVQFISSVIPSIEDITSQNLVVLGLLRDVARRVLDPSADIQVFGSAASGLCERGSDIDATVIVDFGILSKRFYGKHRTPNVGHETRQLCSEAVCAIAKYVETTKGTGLAVEGLIHGAKVPIVVLSSFGRQIIDVSINNVLPTFNTKLLAEYGKLDKRVIGLIVCVKRWAKMSQISDAKMGNLSSYSWSLLCIYYLQYAGVVPSLQARAPPGSGLYNCPSTGKTFDVGFLSDRSAVIEKSFCKDSDLCLVELLCGFFNFYDKEFKWGSEVVSIRVGGNVRKCISDQEFVSLSNGPRFAHELPATIDRIHIEDPFDLTRNLHCVMDSDGLIRLRKAFADISHKLHGADINVLTHLAKTLMSYKNVVAPFSTAELNKRYGSTSSAASTAVIGPPQQISNNTISQYASGVGIMSSSSAAGVSSNVRSPVLQPSVDRSSGGATATNVSTNTVATAAATAATNSLNQQIGDDDQAAAILRNYARQQEILERQIYNLKQREVMNTMFTSSVTPTFQPAASKGNSPVLGPRILAPGRGSYKQLVMSGKQKSSTWQTVDLW